MTPSQMRKGTMPSGVLITALLLAACSAAGGSPAATAPGAPATVPTASPPTTAPVTTPTTAVTATATTPATASVEATSTAGSQTTNQTGQASRYVLVPDASQARYRVREQLANRSFPSDAVGTTRSVTGTLTIQPDGTVVSSASGFTVTLTTLQSDQSQRDNFIKRNTLQTSQYPSATFVPTATIGLANPLPASGNVSFQLVGDLTVHSVTKPVTWVVTGTVDSGAFTGTATTEFKFEDFGMSPPRVFVVLSVQDNIKLEMDFKLQKVASGV